MSDADEVGSLAEEAAKLLGALSGWACEHAGEATEGLSGLTSHAASAAHGLDGHLATGAPECTVCPLCRVVHGVRQLGPEVTTHLASAASSLAQAAAVLIATPPTPPPDRADVEHIPLDEDWPEGT